MDDGLLRQRRSLIAISLLLILFDFADVRIAKVGLLGTDLIVGDPRVLTGFAWVVWVYFLIRYHQYLRRAKRVFASTEIHQAVFRYADRFKNSPYVKKRFESTQYLDTELQLPWKVAYAVARGSHLPRDITSQLQHTKIPVPAWRVQLWRLRAVLHYVFFTPTFTDYALPFVLAIMAPALALPDLWVSAIRILSP